MTVDESGVQQKRAMLAGGELRQRVQQKGY
jgi:hypothetical protein